MERPDKRVLSLIAVCLSCLVLVVLARLAWEEHNYSLRTRFTEFYVCEGPTAAAEQPPEPVGVLPSTVDTVYACGYLEALVCAPLHFHLFYEGQHTGWFDPTECYQPGWVYKELLGPWQKPGNYRVEVWSKRRAVASTEFTILP